jgi:hypothetical protein
MVNKDSRRSEVMAKTTLIEELIKEPLIIWKIS